MKKIISLILAAMPVLTFAQEKYVIEGKIGNLNTRSVAYLSYLIDQHQLRADSSAIINGVFRFSGQLDVVTQAKLVIVPKPANGSPAGKIDMMAIYLANGTTVINTPDLLKNATVTGTKVNEDALEYAKYIQNRSGLSRREKDSVYVSLHPGSFISLQIVKNMAGEYPEYTELQPRFNRLSAGIRNSKAGVIYQDYINNFKNIAMGAYAPDFTQPDTNGNPVKLSSFRNKYVLIDFWASWYGHCREENPNVIKAYNTFKSKGFTVLGVSLDGEGHKKDWLKAIHQDGLPWTQVSDLKSWDNEAAKMYGVIAIPQNLLLDPDGKIIAKNLHGEGLQQKLAAIFNQL